MNHADQLLVAKAMAFAATAHQKQFRSYGAPYFVHLYRVWQSVQQSLMEGNVVSECVALLHDTIEDTDVTYEDIEREFGQEVAECVLQLTNDYSDHLPENEKLVATAKHIAKITNAKAQLVKLCDRLDNLYDCGSWKPARIARYIRNTKVLLTTLPCDYTQDVYKILKGCIEERLEELETREELRALLT